MISVLTIPSQLLLIASWRPIVGGVWHCAVKRYELLLYQWVCTIYAWMCARQEETESKKNTYIRLLGIILCPSLYHVTRGRGKEARGGWLMMAARPWVTVFLCSSAEKFPITEGGERYKDCQYQCIKIHLARKNINVKQFKSILLKKALRSSHTRKWNSKIHSFVFTKYVDLEALWRSDYTRRAFYFLCNVPFTVPWHFVFRTEHNFIQ